MSSCTSPLLAVRLYKPSIGKSVIKLLSKSRSFTLDELISKYGSDNILELPCGHCLNCISNKRKEWAIRCCLEAQEYKDNCFVTLTYDPKVYDGEFHRDHIKKFLRYMREVLGYKIRYYGCAERGDEGRCHYHIILFGYWPKDVRYYSKSKSGFTQFTSEELSKAWSFGFVTVQDFHPSQAAYVAGYVLKKLDTGKDFFHFQSTRPGIGQAYVLKNAESLYSEDELVLNFGSHRFGVPRYFDKVAQECLSMDLDDIKEKRLKLSNITALEDMRRLGIIHRPDYLRSISNSKTLHSKRRMF